MNENERTESIKQVQRALRTLSKNGDDIPEVKEDGIFGSETTEAVRAFQRNAGMNQTGVVDYRTWEKIMNETRASIDKITPPLPLSPFISDEASSAKPDEHTWSVYFAQLMLNVISVKYSGYDDVEINGTNSGATTEAFRQIQRIGNISTRDGTLDKKTWNTIASIFEFVL